MTEWSSGTDYRPRVTVHNGRAVSTRWADADQTRAAVKHAGKKDGTYVLTDGGWAPVEVSPVTPPVLVWPSNPLHGDCDGPCCRPDADSPAERTTP